MSSGMSSDAVAINIINDRILKASAALAVLTELRSELRAGLRRAAEGDEHRGARDRGSETRGALRRTYDQANL